MRVPFRILALLLCGVLWGCENSFPGQLERKNQPAWLDLNAVVMVIREEGSGHTKGFVQGGGVVIWTNGKVSFILSGRHVSGEKDDVFIRTRDGREALGRVTWRHPNSRIDLVIITTSLYLPTIHLSLCQEVKIGDYVISMGHPEGRTWAAGEGTVTGIFLKHFFGPDFKLEDIIPWIQTNAYAYFGSSGGGLVDVKGELVGVIVAISETEKGNGEWQATWAEPIFSSIAEINKALPEPLRCIAKSPLFVDMNGKVAATKR